jgi:hypothetical protein
MAVGIADGIVKNAIFSLMTFCRLASRLPVLSTVPRSRTLLQLSNQQPGWPPRARLPTLVPLLYTVLLVCMQVHGVLGALATSIC